MENLSEKLYGLSFDTGRQKTGKIRIAPSQYGMYVSLNCSLFLKRSTLREKAERASVGANNVSLRMQLRGSNWEDCICNYLKSMAMQEFQYMDCTHEHFETTLRSVIETDRPILEVYMYQATMEVAEEFTPRSLLQVGASISRIIPDLLKLYRKSVRDPWVLMVIDAKSSLNLKQSHQAQVSRQQPLTFHIIVLTGMFMFCVCTGGFLCVFPVPNLPGRN